ncbi:AAA family ATPase [Vibrio cholerae]|uniref:AAA family ATPase n=1 Tax=Vibrio cholerae TaxID=666 RepID=UPI0011597FD3|nr:ATP-binding protein [Vibrio cholerae]EGR0728033.1 AAA family ATPase [Vibrio cholerae]EGR0842055.1 AAA family ATPase [Vibrio cholerae]EGR0859644.1 AAA family ATPase [Vibrio cholerae]TQP89995.1 AAA family ATPase [Vibrio cholerae]HDI3352497.1 AAA family ATPase [Vibrio cholerae]
MKLKRLEIPNHKGFVDFVTTFDESSPITTIIGVNGVGKSNLIEIVVSIFRAIELGESTSFDYSLSYECRGHDIEVRYVGAAKERCYVLIDREKKSFAHLKRMADEYLPQNIFTYYSGTNERVEQLFTKHQTRFYNALTNGDNQLVRRFFYCRDVHSFFVLLAFLVDDDPACKDILNDLGIQSLDSVLFCLKKPYWYKSKPTQIMEEEGDPRFWYSRGVVRDFLSTMWKYAIAPIDNKERKIVDFRGRSENQERLYLFLPSEQSLKGLASEYHDTTTLFKNIESTYIADLLESVDVTVTLKNGQQVTFDHLSEGERQLLTVIGLMKFTRDDESLFLLDEPDTHLNPRWKLDYFNRIKAILNHKIEGSDKTALNSSQVLLTTHDPLMLTSLSADQIRVLTFNKAKGTKESESPEVDPNTMGVEAIIQSELYGIRTSLNKELQHKIDLRNRLLSKESRGATTADELVSLNNELDSIGLSQAHPNPYFSNFARALNRHPLFRRTTFTPEEYEDIQNFTDELLEELMKEEDNDIH